jgi:hypothetical protein
MIDTTTCETFEYAMDRMYQSIGGDEVMNELHDVQDMLAALLKLGRSDMVGKVVQAVFDSYVQRCAARDFYGHALANDKTAMEAAAAVMAQ